jgi:hypothetical protein
MAVSIAMNGMEERSMSPAQLKINDMKRAFAEQQRQIDARNAEIPKMLRQQIETGMKDFEDIENMVHTLRKQQVSILLGVNLAKAALGEEPFNPRASPMPAVASACASVPAPIAVRPPTYKESLAIPVEKPKEDEKDEKDEEDEEDEEDEDEDEEEDDGFKTVEHHKKPEHCWHTKTGKHCHKADCTFMHPKGYQPGPRTICIKWKSDPEKCKWGNDCKFLHAKKCPYEDGPNFKEKK